MQKIAVIIPVYNNLKFTINCLSGLYSMRNQLDDRERVKIIVVNDGSTDATNEWVTNSFPETVLLQGDGSLWWSGAINMGITHAKDVLNAEYILWWNNDITPADNYLSELLNIIDTQKPIIGGSKIYYAAKRNLIWSMGGVFDTHNGKKYMIGMNETDNDQYKDPIEVDWLPGMGTFIHASVFDKIGLVDNEDFPQYHGDSDFTFRAKLAGMKIVVYPSLKIWNDKSNSGLMHQNDYKLLIRSLKDIKSNYHFSKDVNFYRRYATSARAYQTLAYKYCYYIGGFLKWKLLNSIGISKHRSL